MSIADHKTKQEEWKPNWFPLNFIAYLIIASSLVRIYVLFTVKGVSYFDTLNVFRCKRGRLRSCVYNVNFNLCTLFHDPFSDFKFQSIWNFIRPVSYDYGQIHSVIWLLSFCFLHIKVSIVYKLNWNYSSGCKCLVYSSSK